MRGGVRARGARPGPGCWRGVPGWERLGVLDPERGRAGRRPLQCVLAERGRRGARLRQVSGCCARVRREQRAGRCTSSCGSGRRGSGDEAALWRLPHRDRPDRAARSSATGRPDDAWQHLVSDVRRCDSPARTPCTYGCWTCGAALEARTYAAPVDVVLEVEDAFCPWNAGRWRLTGDAEGAICERTTDAARSGAVGAGAGGGLPRRGDALRRSPARRPGARGRGRGALAEASAAFGSDVGAVAAARVLSAPSAPARLRSSGRWGTRRGCGRPGRRCGRRCRRRGRAGRCGGRRRPRRRGRRRAAARPIASGSCSGRTVSMRLLRTPSRISATRSAQIASHSARREVAAGAGTGRCRAGRGPRRGRRCRRPR